MKIWLLELYCSPEQKQLSMFHQKGNQRREWQIYNVVNTTFKCQNICDSSELLYSNDTERNQNSCPPCNRASPSLMDFRPVKPWFLKLESKWRRRLYSPTTRTKIDPKTCRPLPLLPENNRRLTMSNRAKQVPIRCNGHFALPCETEFDEFAAKEVTTSWPTVFFVVSWTTAFLKFSLLSEPPIPTTNFSLLFVTVQNKWSAHPRRLISARTRSSGNLRKIFVNLR